MLLPILWLVVALTLPSVTAAQATDTAGSRTAAVNRPQLVVQLGHSQRLFSAVFSPDGRFIATASEDKTARIWDGATGNEIRRFPEHPHPVSSVAFSPDGQLILTGSWDGSARLWDVATGKEIRRFQHRSLNAPSAIFAPNGLSVTFSPDGQFVLIGSWDATASLWDAKTGKELRRLQGHTDRITSVAFSPDGRFVVTGSWDRTVRLWEVTTGKELRRFQGLETWKLPIQRAGILVAKAARQFERDGKTVRVETGVYDLRLFRDGQLVGYAPEAAGEIPVDPQTGAATRTFIVKLPRTPDRKEVEFSAYAFNGDRVKSATDRKLLPLPQGQTPAKGRAYIMTVGVNTYDNPAWNLRFAANDAQRIQQVLHKVLAHTQHYEEVVPVPLLSDMKEEDGAERVAENHATKANIRAVVERLAGRAVDQERLAAIPHGDKLHQARPEDLILLSFSTHGYSDAKGNFYFFPSDIGEGQGQQLTASVLQRTISSEELSLWLRDVDGGEMVLIVDACHSAATVEGAGFKPGPMGSRGLGQLAYDKGMRILTASQADDVALESDLIQQGLLTYALIHDGLEARQADFQPQDHMITLAEWLGYGVQRVPMLYDEIRAGQVRTFGQREGERGVVVLTSQQSEALKGRSSLQQPALFDFARQRRDTVLVREQ